MRTLKDILNMAAVPGVRPLLFPIGSKVMLTPPLSGLLLLTSHSLPQIIRGKSKRIIADINSNRPWLVSGILQLLAAVAHLSPAHAREVVKSFSLGSAKMLEWLKESRERRLTKTDKYDLGNYMTVCPPPPSHRSFSPMFPQEQNRCRSSKSRLAEEQRSSMGRAGAAHLCTGGG
jgi:hypothetical protein